MTVADQPPPVATTRRPAWDIVVEYMRDHSGDNAYGRASDGTPLWDRVIGDMITRDQIGRERYGVPLTSHNGRNHLVDSYQEALDLAVYLAAWLDEQGVEPDELPAAMVRSGPEHGWRVMCVQQTFHETIRTVVRLRAFIEEMAAPT